MIIVVIQTVTVAILALLNEHDTQEAANLGNAHTLNDSCAGASMDHDPRIQREDLDSAVNFETVGTVSRAELCGAEAIDHKS